MISGVPAGKRPAALYGASATEPALFLWAVLGRFRRVGAVCLGEDSPAPPSEPCVRLSTHTALRSAFSPAGMVGDMATAAQDNGFALP